jgi:hypothetical protein
VDQEQHERPCPPLQQPLGTTDGLDQDPASVNSHRNEGIATLAVRAYTAASSCFKTLAAKSAGSLGFQREEKATAKNTKNTNVRMRWTGPSR